MLLQYILITYIIIHLICILWMLFVFNINQYEMDSFELCIIILTAPALIILFTIWSHSERRK